MDSLRSIARFAPWVLCLLGSVVCALMPDPGAGIWFLVFLALSLLGCYDLIQSRHAILRNYPVTGHLRFLLEDFRAEIRQYFIEDDRDPVPFSRNQRALVYKRAKNLADTQAFGSIDNPYKEGYAWLNHSIQPVPAPALETLRVQVGGPACAKPYGISIFNVSAMSFGALSANAIMALNKGAQIGGFAHDTGEGSISEYHEKYGGDLIWELGTGYFGCRTSEGHFDPEKFVQVAKKSQVKMIEIKMSQGAKPGHGGLLPGSKVTPEIARARGIPVGEDCHSPAAHSAFDSPLGLMQFIETLRRLSGGKPVGFKFCMGHVGEWFAIIRAMLQTGTTPDFIVVDGSEGGTGAAPVEFCDHIGMPLRDALQLVHATLVGAGLRDKIRLGASGKLISSFDILQACALGADWVNSARGFMFALGCIQSRACDTDRCPTGVATQDPYRQHALQPADKAQRVANFHRNTVKSVAALLGASGLRHTRDVTPHHILHRNEAGQIETLTKHLLVLDEGALNGPQAEQELDAYAPRLSELWRKADPARWHR